ncbi:RsmB/NOP family class I SAM-dependent RNA methyltransferase [Aurantimonas sp. MSK8Z-1]|uniref:RsmB/NOP family class I SAM-dependent RNA methyltransferase n=1 Tax=Mangrovibrevibacter kandeliae TaxID=2968473 RepID=UPI002117349F|nr:RsmB/NOP family class I SAM-dependent RNA methyltransferase [Aurantimonas sp. MSK8Z-1]MCW4117080.1 RsmB/NOP family class I SAM-dependent RNA methyltransferase [Aurantimonas sp. MSK8Z-1]
MSRGAFAGRRAGSNEQTPQAAVERPGLAARQIAAKLLGAVLETGTSADGLTDPAHGQPGFRALEPRDQALVKAILLSALRFHGSIAAMLDACLDRPLPAKAAALRHLLHVGATQILHLGVPDSAAVDLAVESANADPRNRRYAGMVNAVLRRLSRERDALVTRYGDARLDCPAWFYERLVAAYGNDAAARIAAAHRLPPPLDLTVKRDPALWAERLGGRLLPTGSVRLPGNGGPVTELEGFAEGEWWVQDAAAALPARLFGDLDGKRAADLCAAPGGKTAQLALAGAEVTAVEISVSRLRRLRANLERLGLTAQLVQGDLSTLRAPALFDALLLDAPCSSTGTLRRHPDVAFTKSPAEIEKLAAVQARLLADAAKLAAPGGRLIFSNCSLDPLEGEAVADAFLAEHRHFALDPVSPDEVTGLAEAVSPTGMLRTTPAMLDLGDPALSGLDGFFAARFRRIA